MKYFKHETAIIDSPCDIGEGTKIWHFSHIMKNAQIGENCVLGQNTFIASDVKIGGNVKIQNNVSIYEGVSINDNVFIGPSVVFTNVINPRSEVIRKSEYLKTKIGTGVSIGANATIVCGVTISDYAFIGAGSVVTKDVKAFALIKGNPGIQDGWMCKNGFKLIFNHGIAESQALKYKLEDDQVTLIEDVKN